ncbi:MAG: hypothetical protein ACTHPD_12235 [Rhizomicrobium sp.]
MRDFLLGWIGDAPLLAIGAILFACTVAAAIFGASLRARHAARPETDGDKDSSSHESYIVSAVLGLLALLMGFTFSLAIDRFETRRALVVEDANAIGTAYLRAQLLGAPHRARLSKLLIAYTDNLITLAKLPPAEARAKVADDDRLLNDIWAASAAAFDSIKQYDFSSTFADSMNAMIDMDSSRRAARQAHVPPEVFGVLLIYLVGTAGVLGYVLGLGRARFAAAFLLLLLCLSLLLILDIDRATGGGITESQGPMEALSRSLHAQDPAIFDRWREPANSM